MHQRTQACARTQVTQEWSEDLHARAAWCLDSRRLEFEAALGQLRTSDVATVDRAVALAASLPATELCGDATVLNLQPAPPGDEARATTTEALAEIGRARALRKTGKFAEGLEAARNARRILEASPTSPVVPNAMFAEGVLLMKAGDYAAANTTLTEAYVAAATARNWTVAARAAEHLMFNLGSNLARPDEGAAWEAHARVAAELGGDPTKIHATAAPRTWA